MNFFVAKQQFELEFVHRILKKTKGNVARASQLSGMNRNSFYDLLTRTAVDPEQYRNQKALVDLVRKWWTLYGS